MSRGEIVYHPSEPIKHLYFPDNCIISVLTVFDDGASIESGIIGREGMTGTTALLSGDVPSAARETSVQTAGHSWRIKTDSFRSVLDNSEVLRRFVSSYASAFFEQVAQIGACSNHHSVSERLARLLLMCRERVDGNSIDITQDLLAHMLCAHRPSITLAAAQLKEAGLIDYLRGSIAILDQKGLEKVACECYDTIAERYRQYLLSLEIRNLAQRAQSAGNEMKSQLWQRRKLVTETNTRLNDLQRSVNGLRSVRGEYSLCSGCHDYVFDSTGRWLSIESLSGNRFNIIMKKDRCPSCVAA